MDGLSGINDRFQFAKPVEQEKPNKMDENVRCKQTKRFNKIVEKEHIEVDVMMEDKNTQLRNMIKEDVQYVEYSEEMGKDIIEKYEFSEENESFQLQNTSNTSLTEYDLKVSDLVSKSEMDWNCTACSYSTKNKSHIREHAEKHITGFSFDCMNCDKTFSQKRNLRSHKYSCKKQKLE